jgi:hypothetical protein
MSFSYQALDDPFYAIPNQSANRARRQPTFGDPMLWNAWNGRFAPTAVTQQLISFSVKPYQSAN